MQFIMDYILILFLSAAVINDFRIYRIPNRLIISGIISGCVLNCIKNGLGILPYTFGGCILPVLLLMILNIFSMLGAGDIKLFMIVGTFLGVRGVFFSIIAAFVLGAVLSLIIMIKQHNLFGRLNYLFHYFVHLHLTRNVYPYYDLKQPNKKETIHFSLCIFGGAMIYIAFFR